MSRVKSSSGGAATTKLIVVALAVVLAVSAVVSGLPDPSRRRDKHNRRRQFATTTEPAPPPIIEATEAMPAPPVDESGGETFVIVPLLPAEPTMDGSSNGTEPDDPWQHSADNVTFSLQNRVNLPGNCLSSGCPGGNECDAVTKTCRSGISDV